MAVDLLAVVFLAVDLLAVVFLAVDLLAVVFLALVFLALVLLAGTVAPLLLALLAAYLFGSKRGLQASFPIGATWQLTTDGDLPLNPWWSEPCVVNRNNTPGTRPCVASVGARIDGSEPAAPSG